MQAFLKRGASYFTPTSSQTNLALPTEADGPFQKAPCDTIFTKTDPKIDGEECLHDCDSCTIRYPSKFIVDTEDSLYGGPNGWATHLVIATGKSDWVRDVDDEEGSVMQAINKAGIEPDNGRLKISASNIPLPYGTDDYSGPTSAVLLPAFTVIENLTPSAVPELITTLVSPSPTTTTPLTRPSPGSLIATPPSEEGGSPPSPTTAPSPPPSLPTTLKTHPYPHDALILLCSHRTRDARCGQSAPLLRREFERHLRHLNLYREADDNRPGGVGIAFINHVGGHKYSANVIIYRRKTVGTGKRVTGQDDPAEMEAAQCIWLARIRPDQCENVIRYTVLQGKVLDPENQLRAGFDRTKRLISW